MSSLKAGTASQFIPNSYQAQFGWSPTFPTISLSTPTIHAKHTACLPGQHMGASNSSSLKLNLYLHPKRNLPLFLYCLSQAHNHHPNPVVHARNLGVIFECSFSFTYHFQAVIKGLSTLLSRSQYLSLSLYPFSLSLPSPHLYPLSLPSSQKEFCTRITWEEIVKNAIAWTPLRSY